MTQISQKQLEANRKNALAGGVRTDQGKNVSKHNALKHGLLSQEVLLKKEDKQGLIELGERLRNEIKPVGELEILLTDRIIANFWRLKRFLKIEKETMNYNKVEELKNDWNPNCLSEKQRRGKAISKMLTNEDMDKLLRYETAIEKSIYKALHQLERTQSTRLGDKPPAPIVADINVSKE